MRKIQQNQEKIITSVFKELTETDSTHFKMNMPSLLYLRTSVEFPRIDILESYQITIGK